MNPFSKVCLKFLFLFLTAFSLETASAAPKLLDRTVVTVNSEAILESDIDKFQEKLKSKSFQELFGGIDPKAMESRDAVLQMLVEERLVNQQVKKLELQATEQEVDGQIRAILKRNEISPAQLAERLKQLGTTMAEYKEGIRRQLERKNLIDREIRPSLEITEEQLRHYYQRNARPEDVENQYKIAHILFAPRAKGPAAWVDTENRAKKVWADVSKKPEDFARFVKEFSDDSSTVETDGLLGLFPLSSLAKEFRLAVMKTKVQEVSAPIKMADGFHILKVLEVSAPDFASIPKEKKEMIRNQMAGEEVEKKMTLWIERKKRESNIRRIGEK